MLLGGRNIRAMLVHIEYAVCTHMKVKVLCACLHHFILTIILSILDVKLYLEPYFL